MDQLDAAPDHVGGQARLAQFAVDAGAHVVLLRVTEFVEARRLSY